MEKHIDLIPPFQFSKKKPTKERLHDNICYTLTPSSRHYHNLYVMLWEGEIMATWRERVNSVPSRDNPNDV